MRINFWDDLSPEDQGTVFDYDRKMQLLAFYKDVEERNRWAVKTDEVMDSIRESKKRYDNRDIPQVFIDGWD